MKKFLASVATAFAAVVLLPATTFAASATTQVTGTVTQNGNPVNNASVVVTCSGHNGADFTDVAGGYVVEFSTSDCPNGATATATATKSGDSGSNSASVTKLSSKLNVALVDVSIVPEFGMIAAASAALLGGGAFLIVRRKQLGNQ